jgi:hypothetical protein
LYFSKAKLLTQKKSMQISMKSPESKWNGTQEVRFPKGTHFCFYTQAPECLFQTKLLEKVFTGQGRVSNFYLIWDSFPYTGEQFSNVSGGFFTPATIKYEGPVKGLHRFELEAEGQVILYYFSKSFEFVKMSWIAQGLTMTTLDEDLEED